ncbi:MerR family transcriptional regulator [Synechocystis sp. PCC 7339]|uniref:MerR family transcriptional regulator n=1 Tax=unclassified Synechocystis TaxID=2640012 RepID=UPI001BAF51B0|nr:MULTISPECIES: MerR family transcriptional regulator [unclassified Synechocystis]QUS61182.1 MerR family transcriptional regulator [Synechocystis sp. PCC 7338]UAJ73365.1 MerR family transcriptional regulator [Synechocystis sp. PCC 7339]
MLIGELSQKTGLTKDTIRFYEKLGLITASDRQAGTRLYKEFSEAMLQRLLLIGQAKALGFTLNEIKQFVQDWGDHSNIPEREQISIIERKLEGVSQKMRQLAEIESYLNTKLRRLRHQINLDNP